MDPIVAANLFGGYLGDSPEGVRVAAKWPAPVACCRPAGLAKLDAPENRDPISDLPPATSD